MASHTNKLVFDKNRTPIQAHDLFLEKSLNFGIKISFLIQGPHKVSPPALQNPISSNGFHLSYHFIFTTLSRTGDIKDARDG